MAPSRKLANGRSPIVNQQRQITSFFTKTNSPSPSPIIPKHQISKSDHIPNPKKSPNLTPIIPKQQIPKSDLVPNPKLTPTTPSPHQTKSKSKKPLLIIGDSCPIAPDLVKESYGEEVENRKVRVYWPLDKSWYEGRVKSFDRVSGKHLVQYDDAEEEELELSKEKIEWMNEKSKGLRRLRRVSLIVDDDLEDEKVESDGEDDDSTDEDWGKGAVDEVVNVDSSEDMEFDNEVEEEDEEKETESPKQNCGKGSVSKKRKTSGVEKLRPDKKSKSCGNLEKIGGLKVSLDGNGSQMMGPVKNNDSCKAPQIQAIGVTGDASERFGIREAEKFCFLLEGRRDANRRHPEDEDYDPKTLYLPPNFLNNLTGGQRQWWEFKSKHMDKVLFFKMGKFYELFEMDAHVGARELDLQYMKGEQPHCGFPEKNFSVNVEKLARKGFRVLVVEQTETPEQLDIRRKEKGSKDKVVKREICAVVTKGTLTEGDMMSTNPDASYLMAVTESYQASESTKEERCFGVCVVDVATSKIILGQFDDDSECSALACLLTELRPVEIIKPAKCLSTETEKILLRHTRSPLVNELVPTLECWDAEKIVCKLKSIYCHIKNQPGNGYSDDSNSRDTDAEEDGINYLPDVLVELIRVEKDCCYALSALGGALFYLKEAFLDETLLRFAKFELLPCSGFSGICQKPYMVLDAPALESLEIFENSKNGDSSGTLYAQLNHCVTAFGKRMLKTWLARPLYHFSSIKERQDAVAGLRGVNLPFALDFQKELCRLPDMERLLARLYASSGANGRNANKVVLYEDASKKQLQEFISALRGCELMAKACSSLGTILDNIDCSLLHHLLTPGTGLPDISSAVNHFKHAFDWAEANNSGRIIPLEGVDVEYDSACKMVKDVESYLAEHLQNQRKFLGQKSISYVTIGKEAYLLEVPESLGKSIPQEYEFRSSKKGYHRYWNPTIKKYLGELSQAQSEKESKLKSILQRLIGRFCEHHTKWRQLVSVSAELDVLISLAIASDYYEGPTCRPNISSFISTNEVPCLGAKSLGHPVLRSDSLGKGTFVPNDINIGGSGHASFILLTGPNMGGKSTLLRQICLAVILAQVGADVPAESFELSPVDQIFVRMGAKDHIMAGQSTFLTELSETASMLSSATRNSLVVLDELGRGTSTSDGQAIAESVLEHFVHKVQCRGMFSTHYHRLAVDYQNDTKVSLNHMGCQIGKGVGGVEEVTFLYRIMPGACPKSHGVNVARLAGLPDSVLRKSADMSLAFEAIYGKHKRESKNGSIEVWEDEVVDFIKKLTNVVANMSRHEFSEGMDISTLTKLQQTASTLLQNH